MTWVRRRVVGRALIAFGMVVPCLGFAYGSGFSIPRHHGPQDMPVQQALHPGIALMVMVISSAVSAALIVAGLWLARTHRHR
jgi:hypothetical protein